jgi:signal transduction histidine kinase
MLRLARQSLLIQILGVYLAFVAVVAGAGLAVDGVLAGQLRAQVQASDMALAQQIATETRIKFDNATASLDALARLDVVRAGQSDAMVGAFQAVTAARPDVDHIYWIDPFGALLLSVSPPTPRPDEITPGAVFQPPDVIQRALRTNKRAFDVGYVYHGTYSPGVIIAEPVLDPTGGRSVGIIAVSLTLQDLSEPLRKVVRDQKSLQITIIDGRGEVIASPDSRQWLDTVLNELPGAGPALAGQPTTKIERGSDGQDWLFSAAPVPDAGWAVVVQRLASQALDIITQLHRWLLAAVALFALGGLVFWMMLLNRVIQPLHALAVRHRALPDPQWPIPPASAALVQRDDEVGGLARSLARLEHGVFTQLAELRTLLETSNAVVASLDPRAVVRTIIREVRRLVDVQAAAVLVPDEKGVLRVLVSDGHSDHYDHALSLSPAHVSSAAVLALRDGRPVQKLLDPEETPRAFSAEEGYRAVLAIPIISRHAGGVVLLVHRTAPQPFTNDEIDLLLTFANYATLAWEHAVLYERSDERLKEEKQRLDAIMGSMSDGLILTSADGTVLYANPGASVLTGVGSSDLGHGQISAVHAALRAAAADPAAYDEARAQAESGEQADWVLETNAAPGPSAIHLRLFDVHDERGETIGRGLLLRDITREREVDEFKTTLLAAVGHEVRTPLAAIKGHASTLLQDDVVWSPEDQRKSLLTISDEADRLAGLVRDLLDLSRQQAGLLPLHRQPVALDALLAGALQRHGPSLPKIALDLPANLPPLEVDRVRIEVALRNLLANALAYGGDHVRVAAAERGDMVEITVSDDGPGIAPDELPHLFERFYRARQGVEMRSQGTGLGLAICKAFVEAHGGSIVAESGPRGTAIRLTLPVARTEASPVQAGVGADAGAGRREDLPASP